MNVNKELYNFGRVNYVVEWKVNFLGYVLSDGKYLPFVEKFNFGWIEFQANALLLALLFSALLKSFWECFFGFSKSSLSVS